MFISFLEGGTMRRLKAIALTSLAVLVVGCSLDRITVIDHPDAVSPGQSFQATMASLYIYITPYSVVSQTVVRDSLHFAVGVPDGWDVSSVAYYAAKDFRIAKLAGVEDTMALEQLLADSLARFSAQKSAMISNPSVAQDLLGKSIQARDMDSDTAFAVQTSQIAQWSSFSAEVNIELEAGAPVDSFYADSSDSIGLTIVPIFLFAQLTASQNQGMADLYYFSKTGPIPEEFDTSGSIDRGDLLWMPVQVGVTSVNRLAHAAAAGRVGAFPNPFSNVVYLQSQEGKFETIDIFSFDGKLVNTFHPDSKSASWNGTNAAGALLPSGTYLLKGTAGGVAFTRKIRMIR